LVFFESTVCLKCEKQLAYLPQLGVVASLDSVKGENTFTTPLARATGMKFRLCENYTKHNVCNWAMDAGSNDPLCQSCRLTRMIPDLSQPKNYERWAKLETAKRRLVYTLSGLNLPFMTKEEDPQAGLVFDFLADPPPGASDTKRVLTGHADGVITLNVAEADDDEREKRRVALGELYRTYLGHLRHEVGHYYWNRLIENTDRLQGFRQLFGDDRQDYGQALEKHYREGPPARWQDRFVSGYASSHPWEDWAESWSHYMHMTDTLETAATCGLSIRPPRRNEPALNEAPDILEDNSLPFDRLIESWFAITYVLNNLNRGLGLHDAYPFILSPVAIEKLRFIHDTIAAFAVAPEEQLLPVSVLM
jgi:hypothetical protein